MHSLVTLLVAKVLWLSTDELHQIVITELNELVKQGIIRPDIDLECESNALLAMSNGISLDALLHAYPLSTEQQQEVIQRTVRALKN